MGSDRDERSDGDDLDRSRTPLSVTSPRRSDRFKLVAGGVALLGVGSLIGWMANAPPPGSRNASDGTPPRASVRQDSQSHSPSHGTKTPCIRVESHGIRDADAADYASALSGKAPGWQVFSSSEPGDCNPDIHVEVATQRLHMKRLEWNTVYETRGYGATIAIGAPGLTEGPLLASAVGYNRSSVVDSLADRTIAYIQSGDLGRRRRSKPGGNGDGVNCAKIVNRYNFSDEPEEKLLSRDESLARLFYDARKSWYIVGGPTRTKCEPDIYIVYSDTPAEANTGIEGHVVAFAIMKDPPIPAMTMVSHNDSWLAKREAVKLLLEGIPEQIDRLAPEK